MSVFTEGEIAYLTSTTMGRLATIGRDGQPHVVPMAFRYNADEDAIDIGGIDFGNTKKWRDVQQNQRVTLLIDDASPQGAHAIEVRAIAELHETGGETINPRFQFKPQFIRLRPHYIVSWGLSSDGTKEGFTPYGRRVG